MFAPSCPNLVSIAQQAPRLLAMAAVSTAALMPLAHAAGVQGQGTWETTLQGRDLDGDLSNGPEAFFDTVLNVTWLADANHAKTTNYAAADSSGAMTWAEAKTGSMPFRVDLDLSTHDA